MQDSCGQLVGSFEETDGPDTPCRLAQHFDMSTHPYSGNTHGYSATDPILAPGCEGDNPQRMFDEHFEVRVASSAESRLRYIAQPVESVNNVLWLYDYAMLGSKIPGHLFSFIAAYAYTGADTLSSRQLVAAQLVRTTKALVDGLGDVSRWRIGAIMIIIIIIVVM